MYAVLPMSLLFLVAYSYATQRFSRAKLFNIIVGIFLIFFASFAGLYPHHQASSRQGTTEGNTFVLKRLPL